MAYKAPLIFLSLLLLQTDLFSGPWICQSNSRLGLCSCSFIVPGALPQVCRLPSLWYTCSRVTPSGRPALTIQMISSSSSAPYPFSSTSLCFICFVALSSTVFKLFTCLLSLCPVPCLLPKMLTHEGHKPLHFLSGSRSPSIKGFADQSLWPLLNSATVAQKQP